MTTRAEKEAGQLVTGEMNCKRLAEYLGVAHGTVKRWRHEGLPCIPDRGDGHVWIDPVAAQAWLKERFKGRKTIAFERSSLVYFAEREDGVIKIGFTSDVGRRLSELRKKYRSTMDLLACYPGSKPDELALHERFAPYALGDELFEPAPELLEFIASLKGRAA